MYLGKQYQNFNTSLSKNFKLRANFKVSLAILLALLCLNLQFLQSLEFQVLFSNTQVDILFGRT